MPSAERSATMRAVKSRGNRSTEGRLLKILRESKITGWRRHRKIIGTPDFAFPMERVAVFVHGCFWHGCPSHYRAPAENATYWSTKVARNMKRDRATRRALRNNGWSVITLWEHDLRREDVVARRIRRALARR